MILKTQTPLFVVGSPRSGTTLVRDLLRLIEGVYLLPDEFQLLQHFLSEVAPADLRSMTSRSTVVGNLRKRGIEIDLDAVLATSGSGRSSKLFQAFVSEAAKQEGIELESIVFWGDKTPQNVFLWRNIVDIWPGARFVVVVRDPRQTVLSMRSAWGRSLTNGSLRWRSAVAAGMDLQREHPKTVLMCDYSDVVGDPLRFVQKAATWLDLTPPQTVASFRNQERWGDATGSSGVARNALSWGERLTPRETAAIEGIVYDVMVSAGFTPTLATEQQDPNPAIVLSMSVLDRLRSLQKYSSERGLCQAIDYKFRQLRHSSRLDAHGLKHSDKARLSSEGVRRGQ